MAYASNHCPPKKNSRESHCYCFELMVKILSFLHLALWYCQLSHTMKYTDDRFLTTACWSFTEYIPPWIWDFTVLRLNKIGENRWSPNFMQEMYTEDFLKHICLGCSFSPSNFHKSFISFPINGRIMSREQYVKSINMRMTLNINGVTYGYNWPNHLCHILHFLGLF